MRPLKLKFWSFDSVEPEVVYIKKQKHVLFLLYHMFSSYVSPTIRMNQTSRCFQRFFSPDYLLFLPEETRTGGHKVETAQEWWLLATELKPAKEKPDLRLREVLWWLYRIKASAHPITPVFSPLHPPTLHIKEEMNQESVKQRYNPLNLWWWTD